MKRDQSTLRIFAILTLVALLLAVMLVFLSACGTAQNQYDTAAVFAAQQQERAAWLADPDDAALWEALGLSGTVVLGEQITSRTIGAQSWLLQPAEVGGDPSPFATAWMSRAAPCWICAPPSDSTVCR